MRWNRDWSKDLQREFAMAQQKWQSENGKAGTADKIAGLKRAVAKLEQKSHE